VEVERKGEGELKNHRKHENFDGKRSKKTALTLRGRGRGVGLRRGLLGRSFLGRSFLGRSFLGRSFLLGGLCVSGRVGGGEEAGKVSEKIIGNSETKY
jgi:hypothetical protein